MLHYAKTAIEKIENSFGKEYDQLSTECIIKIINGLDLESINDLVEELVMNCRYFPKPAEWQKALNESSIKRPNTTQGGCKICNGKPWVDVCHTKHDGEVKSFRCSCRKNDPAYQTVRVSGKEIKLRFWSEELINHGFYLLSR